MANYKQIQRGELFEVWIKKQPKSLASHSSKMDRIREFVNERAGDLVEAENRQVMTEISRLCYKFQKRWAEAHRTRNLFETKNKSWLCQAAFSSVKSINKGGRPRKSFMELNKQNKRRRVEGLRKLGTPQELALAAEMNARQEGSEDAAKMLQETMQTTPSRPKKLRKAWNSEKANQNHRALTNDEALSLFIDGDYSRDQWILLRQTPVQCNVPQIYPSYKNLVKARERCLPDRNFMQITEEMAEVKLQGLLDHTAQRILARIDLTEVSSSHDLVLLVKWGFDGSSDHSSYKQKFDDEGNDDSSIFITSMVPLQIHLKNKPGDVIWMNDMPSSTRLCRPIRIQLRKETAELSLKEKEIIEEQIEKLVPMEFSQYTLHYSMVCSMIDGKVCSAITGTSASNCCVCDASPKQFNNLEAMRSRTINRSSLKFGPSPLHCRMRFMQCLLNIAYKLDVRCWRITTPGMKDKMAIKKKEIQTGFRRKLGLIIDIPKHGSGSSNDGNTARRFFENPKITAEITGLDEKLIEKFAVILNVLNCAKKINVAAFKEYCFETAKHYVKLYKWYYMPQSVHRVLIHGADFVAAAAVPIGCLSEEPQECRNKDLRKFREKHARKCSRTANNEDVFIRMLMTSDPYIASLRRPTKKKFMQMSAEAAKLLQDALDDKQSDSETDVDEEDNEI